MTTFTTTTKNTATTAATTHTAADWLHIDNWLHSLYKETQSTIPEFERTDKNYTLLNNLKNLDLNSTELVDNILKAKFDTNHSRITNNVLSSSGHDALDALAVNACLLGLDKTELSNYFTAITKLSLNQTELNLQEYSLNEIEHTLNQCQSSVNDELHHMQNILTKLQRNARDDSTNQERKREEGSSLSTKKMTSQYLALESKYRQLEIERKGIRLTHLHELDTKANTIEAELNEKNHILNTSFHDLPSDMILASVKIQETQDQLHELESEREHLLSEIAKSVLS